MLSSFGDVAELVDALDSKSCGLCPCEFESHHPYQSKNSSVLDTGEFFYVQKEILRTTMGGNAPAHCVFYRLMDKKIRIFRIIRIIFILIIIPFMKAKGENPFPIDM